MHIAMKKPLLCASLALLCAGTAQAQNSAVGHLAYTGISVDWDGAPKSAVLYSWAAISRFNGVGSGWSSIHIPPVAPAGLGITSLPDGRRCLFFIEYERLKSRCEKTPFGENYDTVKTWSFQRGLYQFRFRRIAVLGADTASRAAGGQIPMVFAIGHGEGAGYVAMTQFVNGAWTPFRIVRSLYTAGDSDFTEAHDISATWEAPSGTCNYKTALINVAGLTQLSRIWVPAGVSGYDEPIDNAIKWSGGTIGRIAPLPQGSECQTYDSNYGASLIVTTAGEMFFSRYGSANVRVGVPANVRAVQASGMTTSSFRVRILDTSGRVWSASPTLVQLISGTAFNWTLLQ